jgi:hypothetical protein
MNETVVASPRSNTVYAHTKNGFFGLSQLETFVNLNLEPYAKSKSQETLTLDFATVRVWDIAALLWMIVALDHYRREAAVSFILRLPDGSPGMAVDDKDAFDKSADYLRRWRFDKGLKNIVADVSSLLVREQKDYFDPPEPRRFYKPSTISGESGLLQSLMSRRLTEIRCLSDPSFSGSDPISPGKISQCIKDFQAERIGDILSAQCGIDKRTADLFADHILTEALLNVQEHPNATIGMVAISLMGRTGELLLSVVDNGDSIPQTIYPRYLRDTGGPIAEYDRDALSNEERGKIAHHATKRGVTRKLVVESEKAGMGLTYIREDSVNTFHGKLTIITDRVRNTYVGNSEKEPETSQWSHEWRGNLLRIAIPVAKLSSEPRSEHSGPPTELRA